MTIDSINKQELESLYLKYDLDKNSIAEELGCSIRKLDIKFSSFYNTREEIQELVYKFKIISPWNLHKLFQAIYKKLLSLSINYYQIPLDELIEAFRINSFVNIAKKYRTDENTIREQFYSQINTQENYDRIIEELNINSAYEFSRRFQKLYSI